MAKPPKGAREEARALRSYGSSNVHKRRPGQAAVASGETEGSKRTAASPKEASSASTDAALSARSAASTPSKPASEPFEEAPAPARKKPTKRRIAMPQSSRGLKRAGSSDVESASERLSGTARASSENLSTAAAAKAPPAQELSSTSRVPREEPAGKPTRRARPTAALNKQPSGSVPAGAVAGPSAEAPLDADAPLDGSVDGSAPASADADASAPSVRRARRAPRARSRPALLAVGAAALALVVALAGLSWDRWARFDDRADFQGVWYAAGTDTAVSIDADTIELTDDVSYRYALDPVAKTVSYTFGTKAGAGRYWFTADRTRLVIVDGANYTAASTLLEDVGRTLDEILASLQGREASVPEGEDVIVLDRAPAKSKGPASSDGGAAGAPSISPSSAAESHGTAAR